MRHSCACLCRSDPPLLHHFLPHVENCVLACLAHVVPGALRSSGEALLNDRLNFVCVHAGEDVDAYADAFHPLDTAEIHRLHDSFVSALYGFQRRSIFPTKRIEDFRSIFETTALSLNYVSPNRGELVDLLG